MSNEANSEKNLSASEISQDSIELVERINRLNDIEKEVEERIESIIIKKERFRDWTKSIADNAKIQELFSHFDNDLAKVFLKLKHLKRLREILSNYSGQAAHHKEQHRAIAAEILQALTHINEKANQIQNLGELFSTDKSGDEGITTESGESEKLDVVVDDSPESAFRLEKRKEAARKFAAYQTTTKNVLNQFISDKLKSNDAGHKKSSEKISGETFNIFGRKATSSPGEDDALCPTETGDDLSENQPAIPASGASFAGEADDDSSPTASGTETSFRKNISPKLPESLFRKQQSDASPQASETEESEQSQDEENKSEGTLQKFKNRFIQKKKKSKEADKTMQQEVNGSKSGEQSHRRKRSKKSQKEKQRFKPSATDTDVLYLGIDLGTSQTTVAASNAVCETVMSVVGLPKDIISEKLLKKDKLFGSEALRNKLSLNLYRPLEKGVIKDTDADLEAARELLKYVINLAKPEKYKKIFAVIGAPARSSFENQQALIDAAREAVDAVMLISEPFAVAYGEGNIYNSLVVDIGAGTTNICCLKGTMPSDSDQVTLLKAGDYIDNQLIESISTKIQGAQLTKDIAKKWKEKFSFTIESQHRAVVEMTIEGKPAKVDISRNIKESCESIIPEICRGMRKAISAFDPEFQNELKQNIILAGGGSLIRNIDKSLIQQLRSMGEIQISRIPNPITAAAKGALALAKDLTDDYWRAF
ncbi:rod shape-determining protein [candidate division KSB1 bacterium]|nr:rod shape-determining protein [candidate division KSB1 bacterium]